MLQNHRFIKKEENSPPCLQTAVELAVAGLQEVLVATAEACGPAALAAERTAPVGCELVGDQKYQFS